MVEALDIVYNKRVCGHSFILSAGSLVLFAKTNYKQENPLCSIFIKIISVNIFKVTFICKCKFCCWFLGFFVIESFWGLC
jgi:hypothetical protein